MVSTSQAVAMMPDLAERAEQADYASTSSAGTAEDEAGDVTPAPGTPGSSSAATDCLVGLLGAYLELNHLEPELMQVGLGGG